MTDTARDIYSQIKAICDGCDTIIDATIFCNEYCKQYPHLKQMITSYSYSRKYPDTIDFKTKQSSLNDVLRAKSRDDAISLISNFTIVTSDDVFRKTLERIAATKDFKKKEQPIITDILYISKKCPHCGHVICAPEMTNYIICGYHDQTKGYDWKGCGRDWCFQCEKMLCKKWEIDQLMIEENKTHDNKCCKKHAILNDKIYPDNYCHCINVHNMRIL
jgi:hypothetical protein